LLEIFVLPGFGIFGLGGGALVIASLILASQTFVLPQSASQIHELRTSLAVVAFACVGVIVIAFSARHYLPKAPLLNRMMLEPLQNEQREALDQKEQIADYAHLVGVTGMAQTDLLPTGKARIDHELVDVIAESEPLSRGTPLVVVSTRANRVIVRKVTES
jgi:membrane-bound serine protease (ClpP class)